MKTMNVKTGWGYISQAYADEHGVVRVYDRTAQHFTVCHSLTAAQVSRVQRLTQPPRLSKTGQVIVHSAHGRRSPAFARNGEVFVFDQTVQKMIPAKYLTGRQLRYVIRNASRPEPGTHVA